MRSRSRMYWSSRCNKSRVFRIISDRRNTHSINSPDSPSVLTVSEKKIFEQKNKNNEYFRLVRSTSLLVRGVLQSRSIQLLFSLAFSKQQV